MRKTVMIVEDDFLNMKLFRDLLEVRGYHTISQQDGLGAYDAIVEHRPDLILMDIQLPGRSGLDVTHEVKSNTDIKHIPVIAVTAFAQDDDRRACLDFGCDGYISKPISVQAFYDTVNDFMPHQRPRLRVVH